MVNFFIFFSHTTNTVTLNKNFLSLSNNFILICKNITKKTLIILTFISFFNKLFTSFWEGKLMRNHHILRALSGEYNVSNLELKAWLNQEEIVNPFFINLSYKVFGFLGEVYKTEKVISLYVDLDLKTYKLFIDDFSNKYEFFSASSSQLKKVIDLDSPQLKTLTKDDLYQYLEDFRLSDVSKKEITNIIHYIEKV